MVLALLNKKCTRGQHVAHMEYFCYKLAFGLKANKEPFNFFNWAPPPKKKNYVYILYWAILKP